MFRGRWGAAVARYVVEDGAHLVEHAVALRQVSAFFEGNPRALVLAVPALHLLVDALLDLALEDAGARGLVVVGDLEDVRCVDPVVGAPAHDVVAVDIALVHGHLEEQVSASSPGGAAHSSHCCMWPSRSCHRAPGAL